MFTSTPKAVALLAIGLMAETAHGAAPPQPLEQTMQPYLSPQRAVSLGEGRTLNLVCTGQGSPTVILTAGLQSWSFNWGHVQAALAERTRVCAWDRAGYGFSGPSPDPQDVIHTTNDLERALMLGAIDGPYVMVGHSDGAFETLRFTDGHRGSVVGMVLVDPNFPDRTAVTKRIAPRYSALTHFFSEDGLKLRLDCAAELKSGRTTRGSARFKVCTAPPVPDFFPQLKTAIAGLNAKPARLLTQASMEKEYASGNRDRQVVDPRRNYGDLPLIVLTAGRDEQTAMPAISALPPGAPGVGSPAELAALRADITRFIRDGWVPAQDAYAALSTRGRRRLVADSGHNIAVEKPDAVVAAIEEVLNESRRPPVEDRPVLAKDLNAARTPGKVAAVLWTVRAEHCTLQVVFPNAGRIGPGSKRPRVQVWLLKADGTLIAPTRRLEPGVADKNRRQPFGVEILFDYPLSADTEAVAAAISVDDAFYVEPIGSLLGTAHQGSGK